MIRTKLDAFENYLSQFEKALDHLDVSQRTSLIKEAQEQFYELKAKYSEKEIPEILEILGHANDLARRLTAEKGWPRPKQIPGIHGVKWIFVGLFTGLFCLVISVGMILWNLSPLIRVDEKSDRVALLGGLIDVQGKDGVVDFGPHAFNLKGGKGKFNGTLERTFSKQGKIVLRFNNGKIDFYNTKKKQLYWQCRMDSSQGGRDGKVLEDTHTLTFDLGQAFGVRCDFHLPEKVLIEVIGMNGVVSLQEIKNPLDIQLVNGSIRIKPDPTTEYHFDLKVGQGSVDAFPSSDARSAYKVRAEILNGNIINQ